MPTPLRRPLIASLLLLAAAGCAASEPELSLPDSAAVVAGCETVDAVVARLSGRPLAPLEGVWELTADGAVVAIERVADPHRSATATYRLVAVAMPDRSVPPGSLMGVAVETADRKRFDAKIYTKSASGRLTAPADFLLTVDDGGRLSMSHYRRGVRLNLWRVVPYMFRYSVALRDERPRGTDGMVRVYPPSQKPSTPRYL